MGTDMTYDDMSTRDVEQDTHELLGEETVGSWDCYKVKGQAKDPEDSSTPTESPGSTRLPGIRES